MIHGPVIHSDSIKITFLTQNQYVLVNESIGDSLKTVRLGYPKLAQWALDLNDGSLPFHRQTNG